MENHKKVWDQAKIFSGYNTVRKDPDSLMGLSSLFLKKPGLSRKDTKKILLLQDNKGDLRSWVKVVKPEVSGNCRKCCGKSESASHVLGGCPKLPFSLQKARHDGVVIQIANEIVEGLKLGNKFKLQDMGERLEHSNETV